MSYISRYDVLAAKTSAQSGTTSQGRDGVVSRLRVSCLTYLLKQVTSITHQDYSMSDLNLGYNKGVAMSVVDKEGWFSIPPFSLPKGDKPIPSEQQYALSAPGTCINGQRVLRALQLSRPLLLEGSPGVGKTSLVAAIARAAGRHLVRINLSEQTDVTDLFGADLPVEGAEGGVFAWRDGPLLQALKAGSWVVLDELNLASQSVLEGLNACLDHRGEVYIPELGKTFHIQHEKTRLFACQNPLNQGGGRKGLPRSFLNRFTQVYIEALSQQDLMHIATAMYPDMSVETLQYMVKFNTKIHEETVVQRNWGQKGSPWEFNLRDLFRWCDLLQANKTECINPGEYVGLIYADRMRTTSDKQQVYRLYTESFPAELEVYRNTGVFHCSTDTVQVGHSFLKVNTQGRNHGDRLVVMEILHHCLDPLESLMKCVEMNWMAILVGSSCSGKSSIVEMLAQLTGNQLNILAMNSAMDTTELLGGFEQADTSRHIEEIAADIGVILQSSCQQCLLHNQADSMVTVARLQEMWKQYTHYQTSGDKTSSVEELEMMRNQVSALLKLVIYCKKVAKQIKTGHVKDIVKLKKRLNTLNEKLSLAEPGKGGGAFEWIDSLLVKSLQQGDWLLVDNVNFCSASVLDRLNALLEPHGVLSINERGVIDGQIPTVKPHPNFRLFLSMDPRHGEISRAMRNRGVEIYIPGEEDGNPYSEVDLRRIFMSLGLKSKPAFDWLIGLHKHLKEELPRGDKPCMSDLLQVGQHVVNHCNHGYNLEKSLWTSCYSVYIQRQRHVHSKQTSLQILTEHFDQWSADLVSSICGPELGISPVCLSSVTQYIHDPTSAVIQKHAAVFTHLLDLKLSLSDPIPNIDLKLKHSLTLLLHLMSADDMQQTTDWLQSYCTDKDRMQTVTVCKYVVHSLQDVCGHMTCNMKTLGYRDTMKQHGADKLDFPIDLRWNSQLRNKLMSTSNAVGDGTTALEQCNAMFNRLHILHKLEVEMGLCKQYHNLLETAVQRDRDIGLQTVHPAISHLSVMFPILVTAIIDNIPHLDVVNYTDTVKVLEGIDWIHRLYKIASVTMASEDASSQLCLFWKWFHNNTLPACLGSVSEHQKLSAVISVVQGILGKDDKSWKMFVTFWRSLGHPSPFKIQTEADVYVQASELHRLLIFSRNSTDILDRSKVKVIISRRKYLLQTFKLLLHQNGTESEEMKDKLDDTLAALRKLMKEFGLVSQHDQYNEDMEVDETAQTDQSLEDIKMTSLPVEHVQLWPLFEYSSTIEIWKIVRSACAGVLQSEVLSSISDYVTQYTPMEPSDINMIQNLTQEDLKNQRTELLSCVLSRIRRCTSVKCPSKWLKWSDKRGIEEGQQPVFEQRSFHQSSLSAILFDLLSRGDNSLSLTSSFMTNLASPLKSYTRELTQLSHISRHIWSHVDTYSNPTSQTKALDTSSFYATLTITLASIKPLLDPACIDKFDVTLQQITNKPSTESVKIMKNTILDNLSQTDTSDVVTSCLYSVVDLLQDTTGDLSVLGKAWVHLGLLGMTLVAPKGPVDPVEKLAIKLNILKEQLISMETELEVLCMYHRLVTGQELTSISPRLVHPRIPHLLAQTREVTLQIQQLSNQVAYRPTPSQYNQLCKDIQNFLSSVSSVTNVHKLVSKMQTTMRKSSLQTSLVQEVELWEISQEKFLDMLQIEYPMYKDITVPFMYTVNQMVHGMHVMFHTVKQHLSMCKLLKGLPGTSPSKELRLSLEHLVVGVGKFPTISPRQPSCLHLVMTLTSDHNMTLMKEVLTSGQVAETDPQSFVTEKMLNSCLCHIENEAMTRGELTPDLVVTLTHILEMFVLSWQQEEDARRDREEQEASLYRFKSRTHGDERSEEEILESEFQENFPQFQQEFMDLVEPSSLEDTVVNTAEEDVTEQGTSSLNVSDSQMTQIFSVHQKLYKHLVEMDWYKPARAKCLQLCDWTRPALCSYTSASTLNTCLADILSSDIDSEIMGGHLVSAALQQFYIVHTSDKDKSLLLPSCSVYDIYHDSNIPEVVQCLPVLYNLTVRVGELQQEWPDHPTLKQLCEIIDRIESFPITSPVMKFLTGLELLLQKAQDWEANATQHVSMTTQLSEMSALIVQWRKLELSCWTSVLDNEAYRYRGQAAKWWFHLYEVIQSAMHVQESGEVTSIEAIAKTLKQFIEQSNLGDYHTRLDMLLGFHCHLVTIATSDRQRQLVNLLWNLHQFYSMFAGIVQSEMDKLKSPIEKELKGFVKIARWSDINYWALKQATEKTHRTLHKHIKQFRVVLQQHVQGILGDVDGGAITVSGADHSTWSDTLTQYEQSFTTSLKQYKVPEPVSLPIELSPLLDKLPLQCRLPQLCSRYSKHWSQIVSASQYTQHLQVLDTFIGDLIEEIHELQALEVNRGAEKEKQKSEAKHINLRKRKGLSDLFRYLIKLGVSYRKGLTLPDTIDDQALLAPPIDLTVAYQSDSSISGLWEGCLQYYYRCISRRPQFSKAVLVPSKELGINNLDRCRGFTQHLFKLLVDQHVALATMATQYKQIRRLTSDLDLLHTEQQPWFTQDQASSWMGSCKDLLLQVTEGLSQFLVVLHSCPRQQQQSGEVTLHPSPLPVSALHQMALVKQGDVTVTDVISQVEEMLTDVRQSQSMLETSKQTFIMMSNLTKIQTVFQKLSCMMPKIQQISKQFSDPDSPSHPNAFTEVLHFLCAEISGKSCDFNTWFVSGESESRVVKPTNNEKVGQFSQQVEDLVSDILLVVQKLSKHHVTMETDTGDLEDEEGQDDVDVQDGHLSKLLLEKLQQDGHTVNMEQISASLSSLLQEIVTSPCPTTGATLTQILHRCSPLLYQYRDILHHQLHCNIATHRIMGKMLSVLLGVFTELATKGFCIPPELSDEMEGEGATDFCDIEQGGIGDGEGVKNVSDQIEDEDQLDDAKRPEDRKKEDESDQPDVKSEENAIEMSEDFDGKPQDLEDADKQDDDSDNEKDDSDEIDKQLGDVDDQGEEKLDEQMWGSDEEEDGEEKEEKKEESGPGDGQQSQPELVAKDDNDDKTDTDGQKDDKEDNQEEEENNEEQKPHDLDQMDQDNYDDNQVDPYHGKTEDEKQAPDDMDLPDDMQLDDKEEGDQEGEEQPPEETDITEESKLPPEDTPDVNDDEQNQEDQTKESEDQNNQENDAPEEEGGENEAAGEKEEMETDGNERQEEDGHEDPGFTPQDEAAVETEEPEHDGKDTPEATEHYGKTSHDLDTIEQSDTAKDQAGQDAENNQQEMDGQGQASSEQAEGHQGQRSSRSADASAEGKRKKHERQPGQADTERSLGNTEQKYKKLKTSDTTDISQDQEQPEQQKSDIYEHIRDSSSHHDAQTLDVATADQQDQQQDIRPDMEEGESEGEGDMEQDQDSIEEENIIENLSSAKLKTKLKTEKDKLDAGDTDETIDPDDVQKYNLHGDRIDTMMVARGPESTIHTTMENLYLDNMTFDLESLRAELESQLGSWSQDNVLTGADNESTASELWHRYEALTSSLSQDLCEQLRLVLEPTQATKLKGDYRTGKRLNMRKVIPYIASQFRKDKIWLRRTKPSKRQYQIMLAIDDSSSMVDNHSKQIAFESLALISNALTLLEAGQLSICSFGETVNMLHPFTEQFTSQSGAHLLQYLTFEQKKTKIAQLLKQTTSLMMDARQQKQGSMGNPETSQLLVIVSDGRGLFMEGMEVVKTAVRQAREANVFIVFVIIDNPVNKDSILDIKVPVFKQAGQIPEIKSYMDSFPFPFYIILRDINSLPIVLSDALRQWFELVTAVDR